MLTYLKFMFETFLTDEEGASAIEYGLIIGLIAVILIAVLTGIGGGLDSLFGEAETAIDGAGGTST